MQTFNRHPKRPDELRIEHLKQPWDDSVVSTGLGQHAVVALGGVAHTANFDTSCAMKPPQLFNKDGKSIFIPGVGHCDHIAP